MLNLENVLSIFAIKNNEQTALDDKKIWPHRTPERGKPVWLSAACFESTDKHLPSLSSNLGFFSSVFLFHKKRAIVISPEGSEPGKVAL